MALLTEPVNHPSVKLMTQAEQLVSMAKRVTSRRDQVLASNVSPREERNVIKMADRVLKTLVTPKNCGGETLRCWLDQFAVGEGFDVCCGNFKVGENSIGIDFATDVVGPSCHFQAEDLKGFESGKYDYVVCNYIDGLMNILPALAEWHRVLKPGGVVAVVGANAEAFQVDSDILRLHRRSLYTDHTLALYIRKVFCNATIIKHQTFLLGHAVKYGK